jgi:Ca2+-binding RTX toxin-like protein
MAVFLWSTLVNGSTVAFNAATDVLSFNDTSISAGDGSVSGAVVASVDDVVFSISGKPNATLNKLVHFTVAGGLRALTDTNVTYSNGSKLLIGDNALSVGDGAGTFDDAANSLTGTAFNDKFFGLGGNDTLTGGAGDDTFVLNKGSGAFGSDTVDGGAGTGDEIGGGNAATVANGSTVDFTTHMVTSVDGSAVFTNIEHAFGTPLADTFISFEASRVLSGLSAPNGNFDFARSLEGFAGNDTFRGDSRDGYFELVTYSAAPSGVSVNLATGIATDGYDSDLVTAGVQSFSDTLVNIDGVRGSAFNDTLIAGGPATSFSGARFEQLEGMGGNDTLDANNATNVRADYISSPTGVTVNLATGTASDGFGGVDTLIGIASVRGSNLNDTLIGNANENSLEGRNGNDTFDGGDGADTILYSASTSAVNIDLALGSSSQTGGAGTDTWVGIEGVRGGDYNDTLRGADGVDNSFDGGAGADLLDGRTGTDLVRYDRSPNAVNVNLTTNTALDGYDSDPVAAGVQSYTDTLVSIESVRGSKFSDILTGNGGANLLSGGAGNDLLRGGDGIDTAEFRGVIGNYTFGANAAAGITVVNGPDGQDVLSAIEFVSFGGGTPVAVSSLGSLKPLVSLVRDGEAYYEVATAFSGTPIPGVQIDYEFLGAATGEVAVGTDSNDFFNLLGGDDAAAGGAGADILDGGIGSNFLSGNAGTDTFFLDGRGGTTTWSTITDWSAGEQLSVWGWKADSRVVVWRDDGAAGFTGITMHADLNNDGTIDTSVTWTGKTQAELPTPGQFAAQDLLWFT